jgi:hypothetical protein
MENVIGGIIYRIPGRRDHNCGLALCNAKNRKRINYLNMPLLNFDMFNNEYKLSRGAVIRGFIYTLSSNKSAAQVRFGLESAFVYIPTRRPRHQCARRRRML